SDVLGLESSTPDLSKWESFVERLINPEHKVRIAVVGKYIELQDAYKSIYESLTISGAEHNTEVDLIKIDAEDLEKEAAEKVIGKVDGILVPGGFGDRGIEGKIKAAQYARENKIPYFGICLGMQIATIEFARNVCGLTEANSTEFDKEAVHPVISLQEEQQGITDMGASMRLGSCESTVYPNTKSFEIYGNTETIHERHRHRYEFNPAYREQLEKAGLIIASVSKDEGLVEIIEVPDHPFFVAAQFHPEFKSKPNAPHPIFSSFVKASLENA
ncbi:UNVERIFIED_CONTAM: hypothetical protein GTU68_049516, partial [Idotea baltica]|nr:hypothetical protein [Idotea baltica]